MGLYLMNKDEAVKKLAFPSPLEVDRVISKVRDNLVYEDDSFPSPIELYRFISL